MLVKELYVRMQVLYCGKISIGPCRYVGPWGGLVGGPVTNYHLTAELLVNLSTLPLFYVHQCDLVSLDWRLLGLYINRYSQSLVSL